MDARWSVSRSVDRVTEAGTTKITVDQEQDEVVIVVQLFEVWSDADTDVDELDFSVGGRGSLPDWVSVYGPDEWEEVYDRRDDVNSGDAPSGVRDGDHVVVIVVDRSAMGENVDLGGASFTISAEDEEGNSTTETISIAIKDTNVGIPSDAGRRCRDRRRPRRDRPADGSTSMRARIRILPAARTPRWWSIPGAPY